jgi:hypothetical protein
MSNRLLDAQLHFCAAALVSEAVSNPSALLDPIAVETLALALVGGSDADGEEIVRLSGGHPDAVEALRRAHAEAAEIRRLAALERWTPAPERGRDETVSAQHKAIREWAHRAVAWAAKKGAKDVQERRNGLIAATRRLRDQADLDAYIDAVNNAGRLVAPEKPPRLLVTGAQGTGKSSTLINALAAIQAPGVIVWVAVPTHDRVDETVDEYTKARGRLRGGLDVVPIRGRSAPSRTAAGKMMCRRWEVVKEAQAEGIEVEAQICRTCPFRAECEYIAQRTRALELVGKGVIFVLPHDYLYLPSFLPPPDVIIIDEAIRSPVHVETLPMDTLTTVPEDVLFGQHGGLVMSVLGGIAAALARGGSDRGREEVRAAMSKADVRKVSQILLDLQEPPKVDDVAGDDAALRSVLRQGAAVRSWAKACREVVRAVLREWDVDPTPEHPEGRPGFRGVWMEKTRKVTVVRTARLRRHKLGQDKPVLWLDGTGDPVLCGLVLPGLEHAHYPVDRQGLVVQSRGQLWSRTSLIARPVGSLKVEPLSEHLARRAGVKREALRAFADAKPGTFVASNKATIELLKNEGMKSKAGHFGALRGLNAWQDCTRAIIIGCDTPQVDAIEAIARGYSALDPGPFPAANRYVKVRRWRRMRDGREVPVEVLVHPDPFCDRVLWQAREAEVLQAIDRVRGVFQSRTIIILNELALPIAIDLEVDAREIIRIGRRAAGREAKAAGLDRLLELLPRATAVPLTERGLVSAFPGVWTSQRAARGWLYRMGGGEAVAKAVLSANYSLGPVTELICNETEGVTSAPWRAVRFRAEGARGPASWALVREGLDPAEALSSVLRRRVQRQDDDGAEAGA